MKRAEAAHNEPAARMASEEEQPPAPSPDASVEPLERILSSVQIMSPEPQPSLALALIDHVEGERAVVRLGSRSMEARLDPALHPAVVAGAHARGERVLIEVIGDGSAVVVGALRTQPTPGIDAAEEYSIEADSISIKARKEVSISAQAAVVVLRAIGEVETYADRILSRAEGVHKIVGRMLRLN